jgi:thiol-disulfide isomerase/thioredoxin
MRPAIALLLALTFGIAACDTGKPGDGQAAVGNEVAPGVAGKVDRSHAGEAAPGFAIRSLAGKPGTLADFAGKPVLLNLWATWCAPCVKEMPTLDALAARKGDALRVVALSQDLEGAEKVRPFLAKGGYRHFETWLDPDLAFSVGLGANLPTTILYDAAGKEVWRVTGALDWAGPEAAGLIAEARRR